MGAAAGGNVDVVNALIAAGADVNSRSNDGSTSLTVAAFRGNLGCAKALIAAGADVNAKNNSGDTALMIAVKRNYPDIVALLQASGGK